LTSRAALKRSNSWTREITLRLRAVDPRLPEFLNEVTLRDLHLGASSVDIRVRRHGEVVSLEVLRTRGQIAESGRGFEKIA